ncbi:MAG: hypothetical protein II532_00780 [Bacteroidales bacterium]|nr:hypothetical protein [Bacteroidales bacterium]
MKKTLLVLVALVTLGFTANAQNALGVRIAGGDGYGAELSYLHGMGTGRLELDLGYAGNDWGSAFSLTGTYQYVGNITGPFNWFAGVGGHLGFWTYNNGNDADFSLALVGQLGIEFVPSAIPFQFSLDVRPRFYLIPQTDFYWGGVALGIRYVF